ncbi:MAG: glycosyltransferase [Planctomycetes bacterium]|nr:glycosyltransferase [Planctomycetota bacterium]
MSAPHILHIFSTFAPAGPELRAVKLINASAGAYRHSILAIDGRTDAAEALKDDADARVLTALPKAGTLKTTRRLRGLLRSEEPDLVCTYNFGAMDGVLAAVGGKVPVLHHEDGFNADEAEGFKRRRVWLRRALLPLAHRVLVPSERLEDIAHEVWKLKAGQVERIPNGIETASFHPADQNQPLRAELGIPATACVVGFMGHLRPVKNAARLLEAIAPLAETHDLHLLILGDGEEREGLEARANEGTLAGKVHFSGHQPDPREHLRVMDIFALSSDSEQHPIALLEAMACSLPVAATAVGDVARILGEAQEPYLSPVEAGARGLSERIGALAADPTLRTRLGQENEARVRREFSASQMIKRHLALWRSGVEATS